MGKWYSIKRFVGNMGTDIAATVVVGVMAGIAGSVWAWASQWGGLPIFLTGLGVFVAILWAWNGVIWLRRQRRPGKHQVAFDYGYGLALEGLHIGRDEEKEEAALQIGLILRNATDGPLKFYVEEFDIIIDDMTITRPQFKTRDALISRGAQMTFFYPPFGISVIKPRPEGIIRYSIKYGHPDFEYVRRTKKQLSISLRLDDKTGIIHLIESESDEYLTDEASQHQA